MQRRIFLTLGGTVTAGWAFFGFFGPRKEDPWRLLQSMQNHLFPQNGSFPDAETIASVRFLKMVSQDASFDRADLTFIFKGVEALRKRGWRTMLSHNEKEAIMQAFSRTGFGEQ